jgi:ComF family protein
MLKKLSDALLRGKNIQAVFGGSCFICRGNARKVLCTACDADLPRLPSPRCPCCALPAPGGATCGRCLSHRPSYDATCAALAYDFPADTLIHALKFRGELALAPLLGELLRENIPAGNTVDFIVPVPLSAARMRARGFNQAVEIARPIAEAVGVRIELALLERPRDTPPQFDLPWADRQRNVRGAFAVSRSLIGASVAVVDDVMTTGATLDEIAATLKAAGATRVVNWVVARTMPPS